MTQHQEEVYEVPAQVQDGAHVADFEDYQTRYKQSIEDSDTFWGEEAKLIDWFHPFTKVSAGTFANADTKWFLDGKLNASYNCIDRHLKTQKNKVAILWEGDTLDDVRKITYEELHKEVCKLANVLLSVGVQKGDTVVIYMPNIPEAIYAMLACTRIGAIHSVIFAGFGADAIASRILDAKAKVVVTSTSVRRGGRSIPLKASLDKALLQCPLVHNVFVWKREGDACPLVEGRDECLATAMAHQSEVSPAVELDSEDGIFLLYTSGSTGKPKGLLHSTAGFLLHALVSFKYVFDYRGNGIFCFDVGWITGHTYIVYGPLAYGATTLLFEGVPTYPSPDRYWNLIQKHKITQFYTSPTAIRTLMTFGDAAVKSDRSSLRILGSVGEPLNVEAWKWMHEIVGSKQCAIVDTYWQTESGGHMITTLPGAAKTKPGSAGLPFFGSTPVILNSKTGIPIEGPAQGVLAYVNPWPGIARTVFGDHQRFINTYLKMYNGYFFTGDEAKRDKDGYFWILGRIDDEINVSGHRIGTAELEGALVEHLACTEAAVVGYPHDIKGQGIVAYCVLKIGVQESKELENELKQQVRKIVGPFATPDIIILTPSLPKTRSGKIMRRILRKIAANESSPEQLGDMSTLADPDIVTELIQKFAVHYVNDKK